MPPSYKQNKVHIYKWRENNSKRHNELSAKQMRKYRAWKEIQKVYFNILLENI